MTKMQRYPRAAAAIASPTPVFPEVGSTIVPPGRSFPSRSAASIIAIPIRSLFEPPGFRYSSFASSVGATSRAIRSSRTIGVLPTRSRSVGYSRAIGGSLRNSRAATGHGRGLDDRRRRLPVDDEAVEHLLQVLDVAHVELHEEAVLAGDPMALDDLRSVAREL